MARMRYAAWFGSTILLLAGCGGTTTSETDQSDPVDAGPDGPVVILDGGGAPATPPDGVAACPPGACNYQSGQGCPASAPACIPAPDGQGGVVPTCAPAGAAGSGAACVQPGDCAAGHYCVQGTCHKLCCGGDWTGCPSPDEHCLKGLSFGDGMGGTVPTGAMLCYPVNTCDALVPSSCKEPGQSCQIADPTGATACLPEGTGEAGAPCPCKGGYLCVTGTCRRLCKAVSGGGEPSCPSSEGICTHFTRDPSGVGECVPQ